MPNPVSFQAGTIPLHPTLQVTLTQLPTLIIVDPTMTLQALQILLHNRLALGLMVQWETAPLRRSGFREFRPSTRPAECTHLHNERKEAISVYMVESSNVPGEVDTQNSPRLAMDVIGRGNSEGRRTLVGDCRAVSGKGAEGP